MECCNLGKATRMIPGVGLIPCRVMIIGEAPGEAEEREGYPFVGHSGILLDHLLESNGIVEYYLTNIVKCRPPKNRKPKRVEIKACSQYLVRELEEVNPEIVILLGDTAIKTVFPGTPVRYHGQARKKDSRTYLLSYHPAAALHNSKLRPALEMDFKYFGRLIHNIKLDSSTITVEADKEVEAVDTEVEQNGELFCVGYTLIDSVYVAPVQRFYKGDLPRFAVFHNSKYDMTQLRAVGIDYTELGHGFEDTMLMAHLLNLPAGLKTLSAGLLDSPLRDLDEILGPGKKRRTMEEKKAEVLEYCAEDCKATKRLYQLLRPQIKGDLKRLYEEIDKPVIPILMEIENNGFYVDAGKLQSRVESETKERDQLGVSLSEDFGLENPASPKQVGEILYSKLGLIPPKTTPGGAPSADEESLIELKSKAPEFVTLLLSWREVQKELTTYLLPWLHNKTFPYVHPQYGTDTDTGRFRSSNPNGQNITRGELRKLIVAPPGYVLVSLDASQIEMRVSALWSKDPEMLKILKEGGDFHTATSLLLFGVADGEPRYIAKTINFAVAYGGTWRVLLRETNAAFQDGRVKKTITESEAKAFEKLYFQRFPGLAQKIRHQHNLAKEIGMVYNMLGRPRKLYGFDGSFSELEEAKKQSVNTPIQGTAADMIKIMMIGLAPQIQGIGGKLSMQIHDEIVFWLPEVNKDYVKSLEKAGSEILSSVFPGELKFPVHAKVLKSYGDKE